MTNKRSHDKLEGVPELGYASSIEWTQATWNPVTGCTKVSPGCKHCYAERFARRLQAMGNPRYANGFNVTLHPDLSDLPLRWNSPRFIFVNSMSDLFHEAIPIIFIQEIFATMERARHHVFQVLTKRPERAASLAGKLPWPSNLWLGVSLESREVLERAAWLQGIPASLRFFSLEPLLGPIPDLPLNNMDWVIVGGESGPKARPIKPEWVRDLRDQCVERDVPFFFKQWGSANKKTAGRLLDGRTWDEMPAH